MCGDAPTLWAPVSDGFTSKGVSQAGVEPSDGPVELEQHGRHGPQLLELRHLDLILVINSVRAGLLLLHRHRRRHTHTRTDLSEKHLHSYTQFHPLFTRWCGPSGTAGNEIAVEIMLHPRAFIISESLPALFLHFKALQWGVRCT